MNVDDLRAQMISEKYNKLTNYCMVLIHMLWHDSVIYQNVRYKTFCEISLVLRNCYLWHTTTGKSYNLNKKHLFHCSVVHNNITPETLTSKTAVPDQIIAVYRDLSTCHLDWYNPMWTGRNITGGVKIKELQKS